MTGLQTNKMYKGKAVTLVSGQNEKTHLKFSLFSTTLYEYNILKHQVFPVSVDYSLLVRFFKHMEIKNKIINQQRFSFKNQYLFVFHYYPRDMYKNYKKQIVL